MIKVVRGNPTPEELAAAVAVVQARAAAAVDPPSGAPVPPEGWSDPARIGRARIPQPGPRAWARTYWPG
ncbi:acyl-CoA carboxylase subunit epsilon [Streptomyces sp. NBC_01387]|uniref:acyl-CoA carboxylase subunit epsilon n=1 Tax=unclassified Streptomyces TaxID=2593676 RepID=UPI00202527AD|nr:MULTISPECIES: acyl-CoA carboxylase subunit epsilon [unclassified Streptomyces]MCX4548632.1 acyl-CoA carboxylase epsilon subunit [Streptomyces sp. NBC_01500]WSC24585.1 acyl-CoA carboxylase subunit epsilon [Streptomyces sp. NBC_01766]WSV58565.1 acyl-CoA carboxylase subunit epsilon [Streptomyces sp. NBC_01014]